MKDFLAETCFQKGWDSVERNFRRLSQAARNMESDSMSPGAPEREINDALEELSSQVKLFADHWEHFNLRLEALLREYKIESIEESQED